MLRQLGRSGALGLALGASAALGLLALVLYQELRSRRRRCQQQEVLGAAAPPPRPAVGTEHLDAQEAEVQAEAEAMVQAEAEAVAEAVAAVERCLSPGQQRELQAQLEQVLCSVASLRSEVAELRGGLTDIASQIIQDVKRGVEDSQRSRRRRPLRERSDSMSSSSVYFTASQGPASQGPASTQGYTSEGGYSTAYADSDYADGVTEGREEEEEEEEEESCATVLTLRQEQESQEESQEEEQEEQEEEEEQEKEVSTVELALLLSQSDVQHSGDAELHADSLKLLLQHRTQYGDSKEFLWRLARAYSDVHASTSDPEEKRAIALKGREEAELVLLKSGLDADCHIQFAVLAGLTSQEDSMHYKLKSQRIVKEHLDRALALRDDLPLAFYLLGRWSYQVATLGWLERKAAAALYDRPPTASTQEALELFMKAERLNPGFSKMVRLYIAKCHKELGNGSECRTWTRLAASATPDDDPESATLEKELLAETDPPTGDTLLG